jgi:hypothetical protein
MTPFYYVALSLIALYLEIRAYQILRGKNPGLRIFLAVLIALSMGLYPYLMMLGVTHPWPNAHEALSDNTAVSPASREEAHPEFAVIFFCFPADSGCHLADFLHHHTAFPRAALRNPNAA